MELQLSLLESKRNSISNDKNLSAVILSAGTGSRIKEYSSNKPKPLLTINALNEKPLLQTTIETLIKLCIKEIYIVSGYKYKKIKNFISSLYEKENQQKIQLKLVDARPNYEKGPLYSFLSIIESHIYIKNKYILVLPGDTYFEYELIENAMNAFFNQSSRIKKSPILFCKNFTLNKLGKGHRKIIKSHQKISIIEWKKNNENNNEFQVFKQVKPSKIDTNKNINILLPLFVCPNNFIKVIYDYSKKSNQDTIIGILNYLSNLGKKIICIELDTPGKFFDIDTKENLDLLNQYIELK